MTDNPVCLIITAAAEEFADEIARCTDLPIPLKCCISAAGARDTFSDESIIFGSPSMIAEVLPGLPTIKWVQSSWAGVTPLITLSRRDYLLTGIKDVFGRQMSEYVLGYLLAHELKIVRRMDEQRDRAWCKAFSGVLDGKRLGIMGTGSIGRQIAKSATIFGMKVSGLSRSGLPAPGFGEVLPVGCLQEFLQRCDHLVSTLPQTAATGDLLDRTALAELPEHAYFINVGRSNVVDDEALIDALQNGRLAGAALDVFDEEPVPQDSPLWNTPNLSITGHIAAISHPHLIVPIFVDNYRRYVHRQSLSYVIDFDAGY